MGKSGPGLIDRLDSWRYRRLVPGWYKRRWEAKSAAAGEAAGENSRRRRMATLAEQRELLAEHGIDFSTFRVDEDGVVRLADDKRLDKRIAKLIRHEAPHLLLKEGYSREEIADALRVSYRGDDEGDYRVQGGWPFELRLGHFLRAIFPPERPQIPRLGTPEGRERLRQSGVPLDSYVDMSSPAWQAEQRKRERQGRNGAIVLGAVVLVPLAIWWGWDIAHQQTPAEKLPTCPEMFAGSVCRFTDERGPGVRVIQEDGQPVLISPAQYNEEVYAILEEGAPECPSGFRGEC